MNDANGLTRSREEREEGAGDAKAVNDANGLTRSREEHEEGAGDAKAVNELNVEELTAEVVDAAFHVHCDLGPGLLESVYSAVLTRSLEKRGLLVEREKAVSFEYDGMRFDEGLRVDLLVNHILVVELKSVEMLAPVHPKQLLTYLRLLHLPVGLLINFGAPTFKEGVKRIVNGHHAFAASRLRVNRT